MANRIIITGNLTRDPEKVETKTDTDVARFSLASNRRGKNPRTDFFDFTAFQHNARNLVDYKKKGDPILVEGHLQQDTWEDKETGKKRSKVVIIADNIEFLGRGKADGDDAAGGNDGESSDIPF